MSADGHALIDRRLYLGGDWAADDERRTLAGVPDETAFATKPQLAGDVSRWARPLACWQVAVPLPAGTRASRPPECHPRTSRRGKQPATRPIRTSKDSSQSVGRRSSESRPRWTPTAGTKCPGARSSWWAC
ncbi:transposase (plasmid) [Streptomyces mirabilis]|nr:transposase [Streptomyces mirabilis]MCX4428440.1 transposase [Streptomyces mirabilis]